MHLNRIYTANSHPIFDEESAANDLSQTSYKVYNHKKRKIFAATVPILYFCTARAYHCGEKDRPKSLPATPHNNSEKTRLALTRRSAAASSAAASPCAQPASVVRGPQESA